MRKQIIDEAIDLVYSDLRQPGYGRRRRGRGFSFLTPDGALLSDRAIVDRCKALVIPPAWANVWICMTQTGHIQCTGVDEKGRKQYRYHDQWNAWRNQTKFERLGDFARKLGSIRAAVDDALDDPDDAERQMVAAAVRLIDRGMIRVGNETYSKANRSFGATTLRTRHVKLRSDSIVLDFKGKSNKQRHVEIEDPDLARALSRSEGLPGQRLLQYRDEGGKVQAVDSSMVNAWLQEITGVSGLSAKSFRTWGGTVAAWEFADAHKGDEIPRLDLQAIRHAASSLGNTVAVARKYYVHPQLICLLEQEQVPGRAKRRRKLLSIAETSVIRYLESINVQR